MKTSNLAYLILILVPTLGYTQIKTSVLDNQTINKRSLTNTKRPISTIQIPPFDIQRLKSEDLNDSGPPRFGKKRDVDLRISDGAWEEVSGGKLWSLAIKSRNALSLNLVIEGLKLTKGAELYVRSSEGKVVFGPITPENYKYSSIATDVIPGDRIVIQLFEPTLGKSRSELRISEVVYGYRRLPGYIGYGDSAPCHIDINCTEGNGWQNEANSVALIILDGSRFCSGALLNNGCQDFTPTFLTAFHCVDIGSGNDFQNGILSQNEINSVTNWVFRFQYKSPTCNGNDPTVFYSFPGATFRAAWRNTDFALMELNNRPDASTGIEYAGWTRSSNAPNSSVGIHHPRGDVMKISVDNNPATSVTWPSIPGNTHWRCEFEDGTVENGSSGSPLFDQNGRIVGQLHGDQNNTCSSTDNNQCFCNQRIGEYGRFDVSWTGGGTADTRLSTWLTNDPNVTQTNTIKIPSISGPSLVCNGSATFTLQDVPAGKTVTWSVSPSYVFTGPTSGTGSTANVQTVTGTGGNAGIYFTLSSGGCGDVVFEKFFDVGTPPAPQIMPGWSMTVEPNTTISYQAPDIAPVIEWSFLGKPSFYTYEVSGNGYADIYCDFTPTNTGTFTVKARADYGCGFGDYSSVNVTCQINKPDLVIQNLSYNTIKGNSIVVSLDLKNQGNTTASSPTVGYYRSSNSTWDGSDLFLGSSSHGSIAAGSTLAVSKSLILSGSGNYLIAYADAAGNISEINETNNTATILVMASPSFAFSDGTSFLAYPVPFEDELNLTLDPGEDQRNEVLLVNAKTQKVELQESIHNREDMKIDTRSLKAGQYILLVRHNGQERSVNVFKE